MRRLPTPSGFTTPSARSPRRTWASCYAIDSKRPARLAARLLACAALGAGSAWAAGDAGEMGGMGAARREPQQWAAPSLATGWTLRLGGSHIAPHSHASDAVGPFLPGPPSGLSVQVQSAAAVMFSLARTLGPHTELELALGLPPTHDVTARTAASLPANIRTFDGQTVARVRQLAPTLFLNYFFGAPTNRLRPWVGAGINYTAFDRRTSTAAGNGMNGGPTDLRLSHSWGPAAQAGIAWRLDERWSLQASLATARVKSHLTATTAGAAREIDLRFRPVVFTLAAAYRF